MVDEKIINAIKKSREDSKRNFKQSFDLAINLKNIDLKKPDNKVKTEVKLPNGLGKETNVGVIVDSLFPQTKDLPNVIVIRKENLENFGKNKKEAKKIAKQSKYFLAEAPLMPMIGKFLGPILAPRNLMPLPIPVNANLKAMIEEKRNVLKIQLRESPTIHVPIGMEDMDDQKIAENADAVIKNVISKLPKGKEQIKNYIVKLTMGKPVKFKL
ncbi:50S ribosomal protein L1 [Candidatus Micrarchaeota archaeon RBG_16_36_9]|nr:MAG: 50S ribosomal protein L1 [Candidatus Micrarchaeota archaeon RBG_16_36_9]